MNINPGHGRFCVDLSTTAITSILLYYREGGSIFVRAIARSVYELLTEFSVCQVHRKYALQVL